MKLYQYSILFVPNKTKSPEGKDTTTEKAKVLVPVTDILANDDKQAAIVAARAIPEGYVDRLDEVQIAVRPFS